MDDPLPHHADSELQSTGGDDGRDGPAASPTGQATARPVLAASNPYYSLYYPANPVYAAYGTSTHPLSQGAEAMGAGEHHLGMDPNAEHAQHLAQQQAADLNASYQSQHSGSSVSMGSSGIPMHPQAMLMAPPFAGLPGMWGPPPPGMLLPPGFHPQQWMMGPPMTAAPMRPKKEYMRKGKWTPQEEVFASRLIQEFNHGYLNLPPGVTLRGYLSEKLRCDPMRITKKFSGGTLIGKKVYQPAERTPENLAAAQAAQRDLDMLETAFLESAAAEQPHIFRASVKVPPMLPPMFGKPQHDVDGEKDDEGHGDHGGYGGHHDYLHHGGTAAGGRRRGTTWDMRIQTTRVAASTWRTLHSTWGAPKGGTGKRPRGRARAMAGWTTRICRRATGQAQRSSSRTPAPARTTGQGGTWRPTAWISGPTKEARGTHPRGMQDRGRTGEGQEAISPHSLGHMPS